MKSRLATISACLFAVCAALCAQSTTQPAGVLYPTQNSAQVNGVKIQVTSDGTVWFLESSADIIARLQNGVMRQWQIRPSTAIGATPVAFQIDGDVIWFIEAGESQIDAGTCAYGKLDTSTGLLTEWVIPGSIPAAFYRAPDGTVWLPQSAGVLQSVNLDTLAVLNYKSLATFSYADMVVAPDGAFWLADFGNNRIVRWVPGAATETSWNYFPLASGRLNPAQIQLDDFGRLWITERSGARVDLLDSVTNTMYSYDVTDPIHLDIFQGRVYVTTISTTSTITVIDPELAPVSSVTELTPIDVSVGSTVPTIPVTVRSATIVPTDFTSAPSTIDPSTFTVANNGILVGILQTTFPGSNTYGVTVSGGRVWCGTDGQLAALNLQAIGGATDLGVPMATDLLGTTDSRIQVDVTVANRGSTSLTGQGYYLYSPGSFASQASFTLAGGATSFLSNAFPSPAAASNLLNGPVRLGTATGTAANLIGTVRSSRVLPGGGTFGYLFPAESATTSLAQGSMTTLFLGAAEGEVSILNFYSLVDAKATMTLFAPDGTTRGTQDFDVAKNASLSFNPASSAFGVTPELGDAVRIAVTAGTLQASVLVFDAGTTDVAPSLPAAASTSSVLPWIGAFPNGDRSFATDLSISNPSADSSVDVTLTYYGIGAAGAPPTSTLALAPQETRTVESVLSTLFGIAEGQGALTVTSSIPVAAAIRVATAVSIGDYGTYANAMDASGGVTSAASATAIGLPQTATRSGLLLFYNGGGEGTVTINGFKADGTSAGTLHVNMAPNSATVVGPVFAALGVSNQAAGRVTVSVGDGMRVFGWAAAIDDITGDFDLTPLE